MVDCFQKLAPPAGLEPAIFGLGDRRLAIRPQGQLFFFEFSLIGFIKQKFNHFVK